MLISSTPNPNGWMMLVWKVFWYNCLWIPCKHTRPHTDCMCQSVWIYTNHKCISRQLQIDSCSRTCGFHISSTSGTASLTTHQSRLDCTFHIGSLQSLLYPVSALKGPSWGRKAKEVFHGETSGTAAFRGYDWRSRNLASALYTTWRLGQWLYGPIWVTDEPVEVWEMKAVYRD